MTELYHHGIKGQRWGVRRFQNKDGSYTPAGKKRYLSENGDITSLDRNSKNFKKLSNKIYDEAMSGKYHELYENKYRKEYDDAKKKIGYSKKELEYRRLNDKFKNGRLNYWEARKRDKLFTQVVRELNGDRETHELNIVRAKLSKQIYQKYANERASKLLREFGYSDDAKSREYITKLIKEVSDKRLEEKQKEISTKK